MLIIKGISYVPICLKSVEVQYAITLSIKTSLISTIVCLLLAIPVAYFLHITKLPFKKLIIQIINLPMSLPHLVSGIALLLLFGRMGIGDSIYKIFKLDFIFTKQGIVLAQIFVNLPLTIKILHTSLNESNEKMIFVARTLGCNSWEAFRFIILPNLKTGIISATVMTWSRALGEFGAVAMIAGSTRMKTEIIPTSIYLNMSTGDIDIAIGIAVILIFISLTCLMLFEIFLIERLIRINMLKIKNLSLDLPNFKLQENSLNINNHEYFVLLGASGSGKTLFLETLAGRYPSAKGNVSYKENLISNLPPENRNIGFVYQNFELFPNMSVEDNIRFPLKLRKIPIDEQILKANHLSKLMQIEDIKNRYPKNLSGGEKQRVAFARALIAEPDILLLDEPMSSLDYITKKHISKILKDVYIKYKPTVIHVTHDISEAMFFAHKIGIMNNGKINHIFDLNEEIKNKGESFFYEYI